MIKFIKSHAIIFLDVFGLLLSFVFYIINRPDLTCLEYVRDNCPDVISSSFFYGVGFTFFFGLLGDITVTFIERRKKNKK